MERSEQAAKAAAFREMHRGSDLLVLMNAWDVASAKAIAREFPAVATSSAAVAGSMGYRDGQNIPVGEVIGFAARLAQAVDVPVSVDFEAGYGDTPEEVAVTVRELIRAGVVGMNMEDGFYAGVRQLAPVEVHAAKVAAARSVAWSEGVPFFINARTDPFWNKVDEPGACFELAVERAAAYAAAGADGIFVPGVLDPGTIRDLAAAVSLPLNIMAAPGCPPFSMLQSAGVRRVSMGGYPIVAMHQWLSGLARDVRAAGTFDALMGATSAEGK